MLVVAIGKKPTSTCSEMTLSYLAKMELMILTETKSNDIKNPNILCPNVVIHNFL